MIYINDMLIDTIQYPNGETSIKTLNGENIYMKAISNNNIVITWLWNNNEDIMTFLQLSDILKNEPFYTKKNVIVNLPYLPYERMDRIEKSKGNSPINSLTLKIFLNLLPKEFTYNILEPHSYETIKLINELNLDVNYYMFNSFDYVNSKTDIYILPDKGSVKRYTENFKNTKNDIIESIKFGKLFLVGSKTRDFNTGKITKYEIKHYLDLDDNNNIVIKDDVNYIQSKISEIVTKYNLTANVCVSDDVTSYGNTFMKLKKYFENNYDNSKDKNLFNYTLSVAHAEDACLKSNLVDYFDVINTTSDLFQKSNVPTTNNFNDTKFNVTNVLSNNYDKLFNVDKPIIKK